MIRLLVVLLIFGANFSDQRLDQLASSGNVQEDAPVKASSEITINAPPERVWELLTNVKDWPRWQPDITKAEMSGPLQRGTDFTWKAGTQIRSRIALIQPPKEFVWTGVAYRAKAIHVWELERIAGKGTLVRTRESMDGPMLAIFFSSKKLEESQQHWLTALKAAAER